MSSSQTMHIRQAAAAADVGERRVGELLRPMSALLAIAFFFNAAWHAWRPDEAKAVYYIAILNTVVLFSLRLMLVKIALPAKWAEPVAFLISLLVVVYALAEARLDKAPWSTTQIIMVLLVGGFVFSSRQWFGAIAALACAGWFWAALPNLNQDAWVHLGVSLLVAVIWSVWFLEIRLRTGALKSAATPKEEAPVAAPAVLAKEPGIETELLRVRDDTTLFKERAAAAAKRAHLLLRRQADLAAMTTKPGDARGLEEVLSIAAAAAHRWLPVGVGAFVVLRDPQSGLFTLGAASARGRLRIEQLRTEHVLVAAVMVDRNAVIVANVGEKDVYSVRDLYEGERVEAFAALPMWGPDGLLGLVIVLDGTPREFAPPEVEFLTVLAHQSASSIVMLRLQNLKGR